MADIISRFHAALPALRQWIDGQLAQHAAQARPVSSLGYQCLAQAYPADLLNRAKFVSVPRTPFPPVESMGLPEFAHMQRIQFGGITFLDTFFVSRGAESEVLCFHELVHVVQWERLGPDNFLLAYALGLVQAGYENSPLEKMAYTLQHAFERGTSQPDLVGNIQRMTDAIWAQAAPAVRRGS
jgi:hypothetical protein